jgi:hypothetical protein
MHFKFFSGPGTTVGFGILCQKHNAVHELHRRQGVLIRLTRIWGCNQGLSAETNGSVRFGLGPCFIVKSSKKFAIKADAAADSSLVKRNILSDLDWRR